MYVHTFIWDFRVQTKLTTSILPEVCLAFFSKGCENEAVIVYKYVMKIFQSSLFGLPHPSERHQRGTSKTFPIVVFRSFLRRTAVVEKKRENLGLFQLVHNGPISFFFSSVARSSLSKTSPYSEKIATPRGQIKFDLADTYNQILSSCIILEKESKRLQASLTELSFSSSEYSSSSFPLLLSFTTRSDYKQE